MATTQLGIGGLTLGDPASKASTYITVPSGCIVESVNVSPGGSVEKEDVRDGDGALHSVLIFDNRCDEATIVLVGKAYTKNAGDLDGTNYEVLSATAENGRGAVRTTVSVRKVKFT